MTSKRFTGKDLEQEVSNINALLLVSGSNTRFEVNYAYGFTELREHFVDEAGNYRCQRLVESGSPRDCCSRAVLELERNEGKMQFNTKPTRKMAKRMMQFVVDLSADFHAVDTHEVCSALVTWAKLTHYRHRRTASGSLARCFFYHLAKL